MINKFKGTILVGLSVLAVGCSVGPTPPPISASASDHDGNGPERLIDGDIKTRWSANGDGAWAVIDYGKKIKINAVKMAFHKGDARATSFVLEGSNDGETWKTILPKTQSSGLSLELERFNFSDTKTRYIKYVGYGNTSNTWNSVTEFVAANCDVDACSDEELNPMAVASTPAEVTASDHDGNGPDRLLDRNFKTRWSANGDGAWVQFDYGKEIELDAVKMAFHKGNARATSFMLEGSNDGQTWNTLLPKTQSSGLTLGLERFDFPKAKARYVKYVGYGNTSNTWNSVTEFVAANCSVDPCSTNELNPRDVVSVPVSVTASDHDGNGPDRLVDLDIKTRWSANGEGAWAQFDYGKTIELDAVKMSFHKGNARSTSFMLEGSEDGKEWKTILPKTQSSGYSLDLERFALEPTKVRYIKYVGYGNTSNTWNSVTEFLAANCNVDACPKSETIPELKKAFEKAKAKAAKKKAESKKPKVRPGDFGTHVPLVCDPKVSDCTCVKTDPNCQWWEAPLPVVDVPAQVRPDFKPGQNFDLGGWYLSIATDHDANGKPDDVPEQYLAQGYENPDFFYTAKDGGLVFKSFIKGVRTSKNTKYVRTELRQMLRRGDQSIDLKGVTKNNWVFGSAPEADLKKAGAVDGILEATLKIDHTTTTGEPEQVGRFIIGQIHANDDEPIRLYFRMLPGHKKGSIYFAHENRNEGSDIYYNLVGSRSGGAPDPVDGIALGDVFSYRIEVKGNDMTVTLSRDGYPDAIQKVDMSNSGYDAGGQYMYFKAGVYNQNHSGDPDDYVQATFYKLKTTH
ncbi:polysaccharide lyase family 7 protein [Marinomonas sp. C2222]|uniref:Polysaccharide lyase family 7 protein n=1 Tax=Marinomonas sargassi TaxID=2984494 RepID=A0ABT2YS25_9GAMM|nr:polysaccharide lyase family 7 protein [Marinomonas sargassi]MCV2402449.1 polysaccharide lyase family 7 protein [Marinomonas sargassi]